MSEEHQDISTWNPAEDRDRRENPPERRNGKPGVRVKVLGNEVELTGSTVISGLQLVLQGVLCAGLWFMATQIERLAIAEEATAVAQRMSTCMLGSDPAQSLKERHERCELMWGRKP